MKTKDIAAEYGIDQEGFEAYLKKVDADCKSTLFGLSLNDDIPGHVERYKKYLVDKAEMEKASAEILITSGFNFEGYRIKKYSGYISGDDAVSVGRGGYGIFAEDTKENLTKSLVKIRRQAIKELKEAAYALGCNAVIGVDFDYITLEPETEDNAHRRVYLPFVFCVTANGTAVIIEKDE